VEPIERKIKQGHYEKMHEVLYDIEQLKKEYMEGTEEFKGFSGRDLLLKEATEKLVTKAFEEIQRRERETNLNQVRQL